MSLGPRCIAFLRSGRRCGRRSWTTIEATTLSWDPVKGVGEEMPGLAFCGIHAGWAWRKSDAAPRKRVAHGWLGSINGGYYARVFARRVGARISPWFLARKRPSVFGQIHREKVFP